MTTSRFHPASVYRTLRPVWVALLACAALFAFGGPPVATVAQAQGQPAFDLNAALAAAQPGATIHVPAGVYPGPLVIAQAVTLEGQDWPVIEGTGHGDVITIEAADVTLRGFVIRNSGISLDRENAGVTGVAANLTIENNRFEDTLFGIYLKNAPGSIVRGNLIHSKDLPLARRGDGIRLWYSQGCVVENNYVSGSRDLVIWFSPDAVVRGNTIENGRYGLHFMFSDNQVLEDNVSRGNSVGVYLMYGRGLVMRRNVILDNRGPSGYGVGLKDVDDVIAEDNRLVGNRVGLYIDNSPREPSAVVHFTRNLIAYNEIGAELLPLVKRNTYTQNVFWENGEQIAIAGGGELKDNFWSVDGQGNYWSDYAGFDADGDRVGDLAYRPQSLYEDLLAVYPPLAIFRRSPVADAVDLAARAFPIFQPTPKIADEHPLMTPPSLPDAPSLPAQSSAGILVVALSLTAVAVVILVAGARRFSGVHP